MLGTIEEVSTRVVGSSLADDHLAGVTAIQVVSSGDFTEDGGDIILIDGFEYAVEGIVFEEGEEDSDSLLINPGLQADAGSGTAVALIPVETQMVALVRVEEGIADDAVEAIVPYEMSSQLPEGIREIDQQESVELGEDSSGRYFIRSVEGRTPVLQGELIDGVVPASTSDGIPPGISPDPEVVPGIGAIYLRWTPPANADPLRFEVHASVTPGFTPSSATLVTETSSYSTTVKKLPGDVPLEAGVPYYFALVAKDEDGAAGPSAILSGTPVQVTNADIAANSIAAGNIIAGSLTGELFAGDVVLGSTISTGAIGEGGQIEGARVELGPEGLTNYDSDGNQVIRFPLDGQEEAFVRANIELLSARVRDNFSMEGIHNAIASDSSLHLNSGVESPKVPPTAQSTWDQVTLERVTVTDDAGTFELDPSAVVGMWWAAPYWVLVQTTPAGHVRHWYYNPDGTIRDTLVVWDWANSTYSKLAVCAFGSSTARIYQYNSKWRLVLPNGGWYLPPEWVNSYDYPMSLVWFPDYQQVGLVQAIGTSLQIRRVNHPASSADSLVSQQVYTGAAGTALSSSWRVRGVAYGSGLTDPSTRFVHVVGNSSTAAVMDTSGVRKNVDGADEEFTLAHTAVAFAHNGSNFYSLSSTGVLVKYENQTWPEKNVYTWLGTSLFDSDPAGDQANPHPGQTAGQHETPVGSFTSFLRAKRSKLTVTVSETPDAGGDDDPDKWKVYHYRGTGAPEASDLSLMATMGSPSARVSTTITEDPTGSPPPGGVEGHPGAVNNFPGANPAVLKSAGVDGFSEPYIELRGDGSGRVGPLSWDNEGSVAQRQGPPLDGAELRWVGPVVYGASTSGMGLVPHGRDRDPDGVIAISTNSTRSVSWAPTATASNPGYIALYCRVMSTAVLYDGSMTTSVIAWWDDVV